MNAMREFHAAVGRALVLGYRLDLTCWAPCIDPNCDEPDPPRDHNDPQYTCTIIDIDAEQGILWELVQTCDADPTWAITHALELLYRVTTEDSE